MNYTNKHQLSNLLVSILTSDTGNQSPQGLRVTRLINPPRIGVLLKHYRDRIEVDVGDTVASAFGTAFHSWVENAITQMNDPSYILEERIAAEINIGNGPVTISGQLDIQKVRADNSIDIKDTKTCKMYKVKEKKYEDWEKQLNVYAWLVRKTKKVNSISVLAFMKDWKRDAYNPPCAVQEIPIPLWPEEKAERYIKKRVKLHTTASVDNLPLCTDEERWVRGDKTVAVVKPGARKATKLFTTKEEAEQYIEESGEDFRLEKRKPFYIRCENWCEVAPFCDQHKRG